MSLKHVVRAPSITLEGAVAVTEGAIGRAREMERRVTVAVLDRFGRIVSAQCMDGCVNAAFEVALAKARHSANFRRPTKFQQDLLTEKQLLPILAIPGMMPLEGGLEIQFDGETVGAIGVSGATAAEDAEIAAAGILAAGYVVGQPAEAATPRA